MIEIIRKYLWGVLGINFYNYLKGKNTTYLKDATWAEIGKKTYDNGAFVWKWYNHSTLEIGKYCSIAANVNFICDSGYHTESEITSFPLFHEILDKNDQVFIRNQFFKVSEISEKIRPKKSDIKIGNDVWIGMNVTILPGVKIGNGVTVLAGSVISTDAPDYAIVGGVPGKTIKLKHSKEIIDKLNKICWWNWPQDKIKTHINDFYLPIDIFIKKHL